MRDRKICCFIVDVRRLLPSLLLLLIGLPVVAPLLLLGQRRAVAVPACCRRGGAHHCLMTQAEGAADSGDETVLGTTVAMRAPADRCPFAARVLPRTHLGCFAYELNATEAAPLGLCGVRAAGTERFWRGARDRARPKRGPPTAFL